MFNHKDNTNSLTHRHTSSRSVPTCNWRQGLIDRSTSKGQKSSNHHHWPSAQNPSKFFLALLITLAIIIVQILIFHYYLGLRRINSRVSRNLVGSVDPELLGQHEWICSSFSHLESIRRIASKHEVDLVIIDPDLLELFEPSINLERTLDQDEISFSKSSPADSRKHQESRGYKTVIHLAAINETSGGQPNLKLFHNSLKHSGYVVAEYYDASEIMQPEVYKRPVHLFDEDDGSDRRYNKRYDTGNLQTGSDPLVSKIYTKFLSHLLVLNATEVNQLPQVAGCSSLHVGDRFTVIHIMVMYNYEYDPEKSWIQSSLQLDELDKHRLLSHGLHFMDFKIPIQRYYIHTKRDLIPLRAGTNIQQGITGPITNYNVLKGDPLLHYINNAYLHCKQSMFMIAAQLDNLKKLSNYLSILDDAKPLRHSPFRDLVMNQMVIAFQFMDVFSRTYGGFNYWITGSTLLAYHKFCELILVPSGQSKPDKFLSRSGGSEEDDLVDVDDPLEKLENDVVINLELGVFADELNSSMLEDLSKENMIGVTMISDWRKTDGHISFHVTDCPNLIFNIYPYELRQDFYQHYFITRNSMILNHKFRKKRSSSLFRVSTQTRHSLVEQHHVFTTRDLDLCFTRIDRFHPFKVPCDVHEHLRRIYVI